MKHNVKIRKKIVQNMFRCEPELMDGLIELAEKESRSVNSQLKYLVKQAVDAEHAKNSAMHRREGDAA